LLGADANKLHGKRNAMLSVSPLIAVCVGYGRCASARAQLVAELIACGADPTADRMWFDDGAAGSDVVGGSGAPLNNCATRGLDDVTRRALAELCVGPRRLQTLSTCVVRNCLAAAEFDGVVKNADRLPLPPVLKALVKLELTDM